MGEEEGEEAREGGRGNDIRSHVYCYVTCQSFRNTSVSF